MRIIITYLFVFFGLFLGQAQDVVHSLPAAIITDSIDQSRLQFNAPYTGADSTFRMMNMAMMSDMIVFNPTGITRSNGPGKVTTFSKFGLPAEHTVVMWNDISLNSALNGITDFSTIPSFLINQKRNKTIAEDIRVQLSSNKKVHPSSELLLETGAYNYYNGGLKHGLKIGQSNLTVGGQYIRAKNNFEYVNDLEQHVMQENGDYEHLHGSIDFRLPINQSSIIELYALISDLNTNIPPTIFQQSSRAQQYNQSNKIGASWSHFYRQAHIKIYYGGLQEKLRYTDPDLDLEAVHQFSRHHLSFSWQRQASTSLLWTFRLKQELETGESDNFSERRSQQNSYGRISMNYLLTEKLHINLETGLIYAREIWSPPQGMIKIRYIWSDKSRIEGNVQSLFRLPTYNELYWEPGGNSALDPESGFSSHLTFFHIRTPWQLESGFSMNRIRNRILWLPNNNGIFSPVNIGRIGGNQFFGGVNWQKQIGNGKLKLGVRYTYLSNELLESTTSKEHQGNSLPYVPQHMISHHLQFNWKNKWHFSAIGKYQSAVYTNTANSNSIDGFYLINAQLQYHPASLRSWKFYLRLNNLTDSTYFLTNGYPFAGRHLQGGLLLTLNKKNET